MPFSRKMAQDVNAKRQDRLKSRKKYRKLAQQRRTARIEARKLRKLGAK